jgi:predicted amidohydrolase YtcJ
MNASRRAVNISILNTKRVAAGLAFAAVLLAGRLHLSQQNFPDLVIVNARVHTVNPARPSAEAIAISAGKITAVGSSREIRALAGSNTQILDAGGYTIVPGLQDNHLHGAGGGPGVDLASVRSLEDVMQRIEARVKQAKPGDVVTTNSDWHEAQLKEQRLPYRKDPDEVAPNTPVVVVRGGHEYILNSAALAKWNITKATPAPVSREMRTMSSTANSWTGQEV